jgi:hypothetical protein
VVGAAVRGAAATWRATSGPAPVRRHSAARHRAARIPVRVATRRGAAVPQSERSFQENLHSWVVGLVGGWRQS